MCRPQAPHAVAAAGSGTAIVGETGGVSLSDELRDPWGLVIAGVAGGLAWAVSAPVAAAVGVGAAVYGVKALTGMLVNREPKRTQPELPRPPRGSYAAQWLSRAEQAVQSLDELTSAAAAGHTGDAARTAAAEARETLTELAEVAGQVTAVERALGRVDAEGLDDEAQRLTDAAHRAPTPEMRSEIERAAAAVRDRADVRDRLLSVRDTLLARMQAAALGLEGLVARLAEVLALGHTAGDVDPSAAQIDELTLELEAMRAALAETEALSRRALAGVPPPEAGPLRGS